MGTINTRIIERPAFTVAGRKTWISGQDNELFGRFWSQCRVDGLFDIFVQLNGMQAGAQTNGTVLGVSCVEQDPANRAFYYLIAIESPAAGLPAGLEQHSIPASQWAIFAARGQMPDALVEAEMFAFMQWLPSSGYVHAPAPEMEVYLPTSQTESGAVTCEFWLPIMLKS